MSIAIYPIEQIVESFEDYIGPGLVQGCYMIDSIRFSTLECFYGNTECFQNMLNAFNYSLRFARVPISQFNIHPLRLNDNLTRFHSTDKFLFILDQMMIERWNFSFSFDRYYNACNTSYCSYLYTWKEHDLLSLIVSIISLIGGLTVILRLLTINLVKFIFRAFKKKRRRQDEGK